MEAESSVGQELTRRWEYPAAHEGDVRMVWCGWDDTFNAYVIEWSDGVCYFL